MSVRKSQLQRDKKCWSKEQDEKIDQLIIKSDISIHKNLNLHILLGLSIHRG